MINQAADVDSVSALIQLAVAPVFLIAGVGAILGAFSQRLARITDRIEKINSKLILAGDMSGDHSISISDTQTQDLLLQRRYLERRARNMNRAILFCTTTGLLVAAVIMTLFASAFFDFNSADLIAALFISAMLSFMLGLTLFLREIFMATYFMHKRHGKMSAQISSD
ncbi:DUF2721 domain-containing protein [Thiomicrorhabdus sediminis]|uniref:DUF2721 domain-containing protein n=1 Tax=Thiomicrorhabdus sediminis TaxID=2580412 RepID=A0A4P9K816_9GAMM|nr:DUF2721 domain-containing protein [Thiomicrorhabdus sediminis]QCU90526.1 DUF2721 domain-containing protein [Thiomicrorhabdus sediminis]